MTTARSRTLFRSLLIYSAAVLTFTWVLAPFLWMVLTSTQTELNVISTPPQINPGQFRLSWYADLLKDPLFVSGLRSSLITSAGTMVLCTILGSLAAYPLARVSMPHRNQILVGFIITRMVPGMVLLIPLFLLIRSLRLIDSYAALIFVYTVFLLPYVVWMLKNFFEDIPPSLEAAARMDGCTRLEALWRVVLPVASPGVAATAIFCFISAWNEFLFALVLTTKDAKTVTVKLAELQGTMYGGMEITKVASGAVLAVLPVVVLVIALNRWIVRGLTEGSVKA